MTFSAEAIFAHASDHCPYTILYTWRRDSCAEALTTTELLALQHPDTHLLPEKLVKQAVKVADITCVMVIA